MTPGTGASVVGAVVAAADELLSCMVCRSLPKTAAERAAGVGVWDSEDEDEDENVGSAGGAEVI